MHASQGGCYMTQKYVVSYGGHMLLVLQLLETMLI